MKDFLLGLDFLEVYFGVLVDVTPECYEALFVVEGGFGIIHFIFCCW